MSRIAVQSWMETTECWLEVHHYSNNNNLAIEMMCDEGPFAMITVNTGMKLAEPFAAVKTYSENEFVPAMLRDYNLATATGTYVGGMPVYRFNMEEVAKYAY